MLDLLRGTLSDPLSDPLAATHPGRAMHQINIRSAKAISAADAPPATKSRRRTRLHPVLQTVLDAALKPSKQLLRCAICASPITTAEARVAINGDHEHHFTNPHGFHFLIGCFSDAPGCGVSGPPNHADTWFPGFFWQIAACDQCQQHLGWWFEAQAGEGFYGLILPRLKLSG